MGFRNTDRCCRAHDHCRPRIASFELKFGLVNWLPINIFTCKCDVEFGKCLKKVNNPLARAVGRIYFDVVQHHCFSAKKVLQKVCKKWVWLFCVEWKYEMKERATRFQIPRSQTFFKQSLPVDT